MGCFISLKRCFWLLIVGITSHVLFAQDSLRARPAPISHNAYSANDRQFSVALRGKLLGFFVIEDAYFSTATIGTELTFRGRHSVGLDFTYFGWQYETDDTEDNALYESYERRTYGYLDYKCRLFSFRSVDVYANAYGKTGTYHSWRDGVAEGYNFQEKPFLNDKVDGTFQQVGAGFGIKKYAEGGHFYVDLSANIGKLFTKNNSITYNNNLQMMERRYNVRGEKNIFYMRLNMGYKLFVKRKV